MTTTQTQPTTLELKRTLKAPVALVYAAWTQPEQMVKWFGCNQVTNVIINQDFRVGGTYKIDMPLCENGKTVTMSGTFKEIVPNKKLVYTWSNSSTEFPADDTLVTVEFAAIGDTTELTLKHTNFKTEHSAQGHTQGWTDALEKFAALFANA